MQISCTGREKITNKNAKIWPLEIGQCGQGTRYVLFHLHSRRLSYMKVCQQRFKYKIVHLQELESALLAALDPPEKPIQHVSS